MFKRQKRELSIQIRKAEKPKETEEKPVEALDPRLERYTRAIIKVGVATAFSVYGYVLLDTYRQVVVAQNTNNPS